MEPSRKLFVGKKVDIMSNDGRGCLWGSVGWTQWGSFPSVSEFEMRAHMSHCIYMLALSNSGQQLEWEGEFINVFVSRRSGYEVLWTGIAGSQMIFSMCLRYQSAIEDYLLWEFCCYLAPSVFHILFSAMLLCPTNFTLAPLVRTRMQQLADSSITRDVKWI